LRRLNEFMKYDTKRLLFWFRLAMTLGLLAVIFSRIDIVRVLASLGRLRLSYALASLLVGYVMPILIMAWRWQVALQVLYKIKAPYRVLLRHYWTGMFVGYFVPGGLGTDIYRAARMTSEAGGFRLNAAAIVGERVLAVFATALLLIASYPPVSGRLVGEPWIARMVGFIYVSALSVLVVLAIAALLNSSLGAGLRNSVRQRLGLEINRVVSEIDNRSAIASGKVDGWQLLNPFFNWQNQVPIVAITILSQVIATVGGKFLLLSINVNLPLLTHLFIWTLMYLCFLVPVSIGGFGIREAAFIVILGLFGVGREDALASSFISLASVLITVGAGGLIWLNGGLKHSSGATNARELDSGDARYRKNYSELAANSRLPPNGAE
jgi:glycosyltransferase 2 family protein